MFISQSYRTRCLSALVCFVSMTLGSISAGAQSNGPFVKYAGTWRGSGKVIMANGNSERLRCTATYSPASGGQSLSQALICASDSYRADIRSFLVADGASVQGHWEESVQRAVGHLVGQILEGNFEGTISGPGFEAGISLISTGLRQTIVITPAGSSISRVQISLSKNG